MSIFTFDRRNVSPAQMMGRAAALAKTIHQTKKTVKALRADGHLTQDAESYLIKISKDLGRMIRETY